MEDRKERKPAAVSGPKREEGASPARRKPTRRRAGGAGKRPQDPADAAALLEMATRLSRKGRGLLFSRPGDASLLLVPCNDVHTAGMAHRIDVAFVDEAGGVLASYRNVGPFRRLRHKGAAAVIERFSSCATPWFEEGDRVGVVPMKEER
ncbi:DUF192 domain-containing protein [Arabiibacter massiliensis]|uniref:DUF192 domain-containing protein n=1 Tax=Arabiibacter massiliensis TaxID=1870985 RepID=UPI00117BD582|nr:DUF192 domain-containing protein [Arabiibacter massiliensis]